MVSLWNYLRCAWYTWHFNSLISGRISLARQMKIKHSSNPIKYKKHIQLLCYTCLVSINKCREDCHQHHHHCLALLGSCLCSKAADSEKSVFPQKAVRASVFFPQCFSCTPFWTLHKPGSPRLLLKSYLHSIFLITKGRALDVLCGLVFATSLWVYVKAGTNKQGDHKQRISQSKEFAKLAKNR